VKAIVGPDLHLTGVFKTPGKREKKKKKDVTEVTAQFSGERSTGD
jgi:hypothetical protein